MCDREDYPYLATWYDSIKEAEEVSNKYGLNGWFIGMVLLVLGLSL